MNLSFHNYSYIDSKCLDSDTHFLIYVTVRNTDYVYNDMQIVCRFKGPGISAMLKVPNSNR